VETAAAEEFTAALEQTLSGSWRLTLLAVREGVPQALGLSVEAWQARVGGYVRLSIPDRREASRELVEDEHLTQREAAAVLGVDVATVNRDLRAADATADPTPPARTAGADAADATAAAVEAYPELSFYAENGRAADAVRIAAALDGYSPRERKSRRATLAKTIAADRRRLDDPAPAPAEPGAAELADQIWHVVNAAARALPDDGPEVIERAVLVADPIDVTNWRDEFAALADRCRALAQAAQPAGLRRVK
jgi:hypothetical protein